MVALFVARKASRMYLFVFQGDRAAEQMGGRGNNVLSYLVVNFMSTCEAVVGEGGQRSLFMTGLSVNVRGELCGQRPRRGG
jgi:hypothetical protein